MLATWSAMFYCRSAERPTQDAGNSRVVAMSNLEYRATTHIVSNNPVTFETLVIVTNAGNTRTMLELPGGCQLQIELYRHRARSGSPVWDQSKDRFCTLQTLLLPLNPGDTHVFSTRFTADDVLQDITSSGRYHVLAVLKPNRSIIRVPAGEADIK